jgi:hypothetical protein
MFSINEACIMNSGSQDTFNASTLKQEGSNENCVVEAVEASKAEQHLENV